MNNYEIRERRIRDAQNTLRNLQEAYWDFETRPRTYGNLVAKHMLEDAKKEQKQYISDIIWRKR